MCATARFAERQGRTEYERGEAAAQVGYFIEEVVRVAARVITCAAGRVVEAYRHRSGR